MRAFNHRGTVEGRSDGSRLRVEELESRVVPTVTSLNALGNYGATFPGFEDYAESGRSVAGAGYFNFDGLADMIFGTPYRNGSRGEAHVIFGHPGLAGTALTLNAHGAGGLTLRGFEAGAEAGISVAGAGDVNGDGRDDVLVGAPYTSAGGVDRGEAYLIFGRLPPFQPPPGGGFGGGQMTAAIGPEPVGRVDPIDPLPLVAFDFGPSLLGAFVDEPTAPIRPAAGPAEDPVPEDPLSLDR